MFRTRQCTLPGAGAWRLPPPLRRIVLAFLMLVPLQLAQSLPSQAETLRARLLGDISNLDPAYLTTVHDQYVATNVYNQLVKFVPEGSEIVPDLAESWETSEDGLTWTFKLRQGVQWHHGYGELTSSDVKFSLERIMDPANNSPNRSYLSAVESVEAPDPYTVVIKLKQPSAGLLGNLAYRAGWVVSEKAVSERGEDFALNPVGSGPFEFTSWQPGAEVVLTAFDAYFGGRAKIDEVVFIPIADEKVAVLALEAGNLDLAYIRDGEALEQLRSNPDLEVRSKPATRTLSLIMNSTRPPFDNTAVRKAVAHAIDKNQLVAAMGGLGVVAEAAIPPMYLGYTEDVVTYPYDPEKSKQLPQEAGVTTPIEIDFLYTQLSPWPQLVPVIKAFLDNVGFKVNLVGMEHGAWTAERAKGEYVMTVSPLTRPPDAEFVLNYAYHSSQVPPGFNMSYYSGSDALIEQASKEVDVAKRVELYKQILRQISEAATSLPLIYPTSDVAHYKYVKGHPIAINNDFHAYPITIEK